MALIDTFMNMRVHCRDLCTRIISRRCISDIFGFSRDIKEHMYINNVEGHKHASWRDCIDEHFSCSPCVESNSNRNLKITETGI